MFVFIFYHYIVQCFINMDPRQGNGWNRYVEILPSIVAQAPVHPGSESGVLRIGCLNVRGKEMFKECKLDILGMSETKLRESRVLGVLEVSNLV